MAVSVASFDRSTGDVGTSTVSDHIPTIPRHDKSVEPNAAVDGDKSNRKPTTSATTKLLLCEVRDSVDTFGPLKSVVGGLCFIFENWEV